MKSLLAATDEAQRLNKKYLKNFFVVFVPEEEDGPFDICDQLTLDTWHKGLPENLILYCTSD